ncbi:MAG TPA: M17 family peptidase N-terminal domain-containing protein, partial [Acidimicrobiales bacterium]|nr:M17 family peptidase N-terminal domain-containing protein [Acidimicrobiales bacterium]
MSIAIRPIPAVPPPSEAIDVVDVVGVGVFSDRLAAGDFPPEVDGGFLSVQGFTGEAGSSCALPGRDGRVAMVLGLGPRDDVGVPTYRRAAAALAWGARRRSHLAVDLLGEVPERLPRAAVVQAIVEGVLLGSYR